MSVDGISIVNITSFDARKVDDTEYVESEYENIPCFDPTRNGLSFMWEVSDAILLFTF